MPDEYHSCKEDSDGANPWIDEFLCEYVDGTMDPAVRKSFEECLACDAGLAEQVEYLRRTRKLLYHHSCALRTPKNLSERMHQRLAEEIRQPLCPLFREAAGSLGTLTALSSAMVVTLMIGMLISTTLLTNEVATDHTEFSGFSQTQGIPMEVSSSHGPTPYSAWKDRSPHPAFLTTSQYDYPLPEVLLITDSLHRTPFLQRSGVAP